MDFIKTFSLICSLTILHSLNCQNIVVNGGFEKYKYCPGELMPKESFSPDGWEKISGAATPDYFNSCAIDEQYSVPHNNNGHFQAMEGNAYIGLIPFNLSSGYMEHVTGKLDTTLIKGETYSISLFYLVPFYRVKYFTSKLEIYISNRKPQLEIIPDYHQNNMYKYKAQISNPDTNLLKDSVWTKFEGKYVAKGDEKYITIGIFYDDSVELAEEISASKKYFLKKGKIKRIEYYNKWVIKNNTFIKSNHFGKEDYPYYFIDNVNVKLLKKESPNSSPSSK